MLTSVIVNNQNQKERRMNVPTVPCADCGDTKAPKWWYMRAVRCSSASDCRKRVHAANKAAASAGACVERPEQGRDRAEP